MSRWTFVVSGFTINLCLGTIYAWSVFRQPLQQAPYNLAVSQSVLPFSVFLLMFGTTFAFSGKMIGDRGPRQPALIGAALSGLGYLVCYTIALVPASTFWITIIGFGLIAGTGCGFAYNPTIASVSKWFPDKTGVAVGLTVMGFGMSALITAPAVVMMIAKIGLPGTFLVLGALFLTLMTFLGAYLKFPSPEWKAPSPSATSGKRVWAAPYDFNVGEMVRTRAFYLIWVTFLLGGGAGLMIIGYTSLIAADITGLKGSLAWMAVLAVSVLALANALGRPIFGTVCDRIGPKKTLLLVQGFQLLCLVVLFPSARSVPVLYAAMILIGAAYGAYLAVMPVLAGYFFGTRSLGPNYGLYLSGWSLGGVILSIFMALLLGSRPTYAGYLQGFYATACLIIVAMALSVAMKPPMLQDKNAYALTQSLHPAKKMIGASTSAAQLESTLTANLPDTKAIQQRAYDRAFEYEQKYGSCPQCVLAAIQDEFGTINDDVIKAGHALAGGIGLSTEGTCGALTGGVMALSCKYGRSRENFDKGSFLKSYSRAKKLHDRFVEEYGSTTCREVHKKLFGRTFNLWDRKEYQEFEDAGAHKDKCPAVAGNVAKWVAEILTET